VPGELVTVAGRAVLFDVTGRGRSGRVEIGTTSTQAGLKLERIHAEPSTTSLAP